MSAPASALVIDGTHVAADPAAAEALLRPICADARIRSHSEHFRFHQRTVGDDRLQVTSFQVSSDVHLSIRDQVRHETRDGTGRSSLRRAMDHFDANLISSSPTETTVAAIARRWGFVRLSRFAQWYHAEFGEQPSETLRR